jgi:hypothetical protein
MSTWQPSQTLGGAGFQKEPSPSEPSTTKTLFGTSSSSQWSSWRTRHSCVASQRSDPIVIGPVSRHLGKRGRTLLPRIQAPGPDDGSVETTARWCPFPAPPHPEGRRPWAGRLQVMAEAHPEHEQQMSKWEADIWLCRAKEIPTWPRYFSLKWATIYKISLQSNQFQLPI